MTSGPTVLPQSSYEPPLVRRQRRRVFSVMGRRFEVSPRLLDSLMTAASTAAEGLIYVLGPFLIVFALAIMSGLTYSFFWIIVPMMERIHADNPYRHLIIGTHILWVIFLLVNIFFNYVFCVLTPNTGQHYEKVVRELADAMGLTYPETPDEVASFRRDYEDRMILRMRMRQQRAAEAAAVAAANANNTPLQQQQQQQAPHAGNGAVTQRRAVAVNPAAPQPPPPLPSNGNSLRRWMLMGPLEWGFCPNTNQPKPPRSHFDHVSKSLVLNLDHYCPWMFNSIGYFNYRYFFNFLAFVGVGMVYGAFLSYRPFRNLAKHEYWEQIRQARQVLSELQQQQLQQNIPIQHSERLHVLHTFPMVPIPSEKLPITLSFMLCLSVGIAVLCLGGFHLYLILTAQTTIEFHANYSNRRRARTLGKTWANPYDKGLKRNWEQVYGTGHPLVALLIPSSRPPEFLPVPLEGDTGKRRRPASASKAASLSSVDANATPLQHVSSTTSSSVRSRSDGVNLV